MSVTTLKRKELSYKLNRKGVWYTCDICEEPIPECIAVPFDQDHMICDPCNTNYSNHELRKILGLEETPLLFVYCTYVEGRCRAPDDMECHECPNYRW